MKKLAILAMAMVMCFSMAACSNNKNGSSSDSGSLGDDLSGAMSDAGNDISGGASDAGKDISNGMEDLEHALDPDSNSSPSSQSASTKPAELDVSKLNKLENEKKGWGQGVNVNEQNCPTGCLQYQEKYGKYNAWFIKDTDKKEIYLTFDEGYENGYTSQILDTLKEKQVPAVFFVTYDYVNRNPELVRRMIAEGHVVGNHTYNHPSMPTVSVSEGAEEILKLHDYVKQNFGYEMTLFRPPMGEFSERTLAMTQQLGYQSVFWSYAYQDWDPNAQIGADAAYEKTTKAEHNGAIYLLHAVSKDNAEILGQLIDHMRSGGYTLCKFQ